MQYVINYECRTESDIHTSAFLVKRDYEPFEIDPDVIEDALRDSIKFSKSGRGSIVIKSILPAQS